MKYSRISNDTSCLKHYIKQVAGGVDKDCQGPGLHLALVVVEDLGDEKEMLDRDLVQVVTDENLWIGAHYVGLVKVRKC